VGAGVPAERNGRDDGTLASELAQRRSQQEDFCGNGGTALKAGAFDVVRFPGVIVYLHLAAGAAPAAGGTVGSVVNHVGSSCRTFRNPSRDGRPPEFPYCPATTAGGSGVCCDAG